MPYCKECLNEFSLIYLSRDGYCKQCRPGGDTPRTAPRNAQQTRSNPHANTVMLTTETALDIPIIKRFGIVSAEAVVGMNMLKDLTLEVRDIFGGRSKTSQSAMASLKAELFADLQRQARQCGADMIIGVDLRFTDFGNRGSAILATAIGTAVKAGTDASPRNINI